MPRFSLVIPTLNRPDTLRHALATLVRQSYDDYEIVIQNNGGDPATAAVVHEFDNPRIRHYSSQSILSMPDNWEAALANACGEFITFIGDDDGLFADACGLASQIVDQSGVEAINWEPYFYCWPSSLTKQRNLLYAVVDYDFHALIVSAGKELEKFYDFSIDFRHLPTIYCSFVSRSLIDRAIKSAGRYFLGMSPDVTSGIVNAAHVSHFARLSRPLSIFGLSHHSTGTRSARAELPADIFNRDFGVTKFDERLVATRSIQMSIANDMLCAHDLLFRTRPNINLNFTRLIETTAAGINVAPALYDETIRAIKELAARHKISIAELAIPPRSDEPPTTQFGASMIGTHTVRFIINGDTVSLATIVDAVRFMEQLNSGPDEGSEIEIREPQGDYVVTIAAGHTVKFGFSGDGVFCLSEGWSTPEKWGTWSIGRRATLRFFAETKSDSPLRINLKFRTFVVPKRKLKIACRIRAQDIGAWELTTSESSERALTIPADVIGQDGLVELEFIIADPQSPADFGSSLDTRTLGIGIEALRVEP